jgi:release factor glutamine methyltransferase
VTSVGAWLQRHADLNRLDLELLLAQTLEVSRSHIIAFPEKPLPASVQKTLCQLSDRLRQGEPVAYLLGSCEFYSLELRVTPDVLIPRPDTELIVECALEKLSGGSAQCVVDLGTGSGAIAISIASNSSAQVVATDISAPALKIAEANARLQQANVSLLHGDWFAPLENRRFFMIVSNPPYVAAAAPHLPHLRFEPQSALVSGADGLDALRMIWQQAGKHLENQGWLLLEHGYDQGDAVRRGLADAGFKHIVTRRDLGGNERVTMGQRLAES